MKSIVGKIKRRIVGDHGSQTSYSQCGEDLIVNFILRQLGIDEPRYLDIGANHPVNLSNTYFFYRKGCHGVCVEPDPELCKGIRKKRPRDLCINAGVGVSHQKDVEFYLMSARTLNTFCKEEAERYQSYGEHKIQEILRIPLVEINDLICENFSEKPDFISLDVEGLDLEILDALDFNRFRPEVVCVETLTYTQDKTEEKLTSIVELMLSKNYMLYADTYINSIFVDKGAWGRR